MRKARNTLRIVLTALVILGMIAVVGHAQKVVPLASKPVPTAFVSGGIVGEGDPRAISITFNRESLRLEDGSGYIEGAVISNPDYPPSLNVYTNMTGPGTKTQILNYFYCDRPHDSSDVMCKDDEHSDYYKRLMILGGIPQKRSTKVLFPVGSTWEIYCKNSPSTDPCFSGVLTQAVTYEVTR